MAGSKSATRMPMMAMTTSSSTRVKPCSDFGTLFISASQMDSGDEPRRSLVMLQTLGANVEIQRVRFILDFAHQGTVCVGTWRKHFLVLVGQNAWTTGWILNLAACFFAGA